MSIDYKHPKRSAGHGSSTIKPAQDGKVRLLVRGQTVNLTQLVNQAAANRKAGK